MKPAALAIVVVAAATTPVFSASQEVRTIQVSISSGLGDAISTRPSISPAGRLVAFESESSALAPDPNGAVRDVFLRDLRTRTTRLISEAPGGQGADGPSDSAKVSGAAGRVVFTSLASNLVAGDTNARRDVFVRTGTEPVRRISVPAGDGEANGHSFEPDISRRGDVVVFTSSASNLVPGDENGAEDVFAHHLDTGVTERVSERDGRGVNGRSRAPSISPDGRFVSFESTARDLVAGDRNGVADVFLADLFTGRVLRVSVSSREREQNDAVVPPFVMVSAVSESGRFVAFDSDATNLVRGDTNRDTDVFVRDVRRGTTRRVSVTVTGRQGNNDSYIPSISADGRYVGFSSFARNLFPADRVGEDVFVHDRFVGATTVMSVTAAGRPRPAEAKSQLLRRPAVSDGARMVAFSTTVELARGDRDGLEDVVVRNAAPPNGRVLAGPRGVVRSRRPRVRLVADDPAARVFLCRIDRGPLFLCPRDGRLPTLSRGRHRLVIRAGGPGMLFDRSASVLRFAIRPQGR